jgi:hypothetical protein
MHGIHGIKMPVVYLFFVVINILCIQNLKYLTNPSRLLTRACLVDNSAENEVSQPFQGRM